VNNRYDQKKDLLRKSFSVREEVKKRIFSNRFNLWLR